MCFLFFGWTAFLRSAGCAAALPLFAGGLFFGRAGGSDLADHTAAILNAHGLAVDNGVGQLLVCACQKRSHGGAGDEHLCGHLGLAQVLKVVQTQDLVFICLQKEGFA